MNWSGRLRRHTAWNLVKVTEVQTDVLGMSFRVIHRSFDRSHDFLFLFLWLLILVLLFSVCSLFQQTDRLFSSPPVFSLFPLPNQLRCMFADSRSAMREE